MQPREEMLKVGGIAVHAWVGGRGAPLLVLHGAGGNRGFTRWVERTRTNVQQLIASSIVPPPG